MQSLSYGLALALLLGLLGLGLGCTLTPIQLPKEDGAIKAPPSDRGALTSDAASIPDAQGQPRADRLRDAKSALDAPPPVPVLERGTDAPSEGGTTGDKGPTSDKPTSDKHISDKLGN